MVTLQVPPKGVPCVRFYPLIFAPVRPGSTSATALRLYIGPSLRRNTKCRGSRLRGCAPICTPTCRGSRLRSRT